MLMKLFILSASVKRSFSWLASNFANLRAVFPSATLSLVQCTWGSRDFHLRISWLKIQTASLGKWDTWFMVVLMLVGCVKERALFLKVLNHSSPSTVAVIMIRSNISCICPDRICQQSCVSKPFALSSELCFKCQAPWQKKKFDSKHVDEMDNGFMAQVGYCVCTGSHC